MSALGTTEPSCEVMKLKLTSQEHQQSAQLCLSVRRAEGNAFCNSRKWYVVKHNCVTEVYLMTI